LQNQIGGVTHMSVKHVNAIGFALNIGVDLNNPITQRRNPRQSGLRALVPWPAHPTQTGGRGAGA